MRIESAGPRTWLLAAVAGWVVLLWLLALLGMGGQVSPKPFDPGLVKPLPSLGPAALERLGPLAQYSESSARPLFHRSRQPQAFFIQGNQGDQPREFDFVLTSVIITPGLRMAIVQRAQGGESVRLKVGEAPASMPNWRLVDVAPRSASFNGPEGPLMLELRAFDGTGGQAPTPRATAVVSPSSPGSSNPQSPVSVPADAASSTAAATSVPNPGVIVPTDPSRSDVAAQNTVNAPNLTAEQQIGAIRKRLEARRAELRQSGQPPTPPNNTK
ncbi:MAG: hypothetical protein LH491_07025 [Pseudoxanthomonas sp.]|nr:hypothetical protein [Pseudoxanthomonas sp.]